MLEARSLATVALLLCAGCQAAPPPRPASSRTSRNPGAAPDARLTSTPASLPTVLRRARAEPPPEGTVECLARETTRAVLRLISATPDCSSVGHVRMVFEVVLAKGASIPLRRAYSSLPLLAAFLDRGQAGAIYLAALRPEPQPARTVFCVRLPATEATVTCAVRVTAGLEAARKIVEAPAAR